MRTSSDTLFKDTNAQNSDVDLVDETQTHIHTFELVCEELIQLLQSSSICIQTGQTRQKDPHQSPLFTML